MVGFEKFTLANGLRVLVHEDKSTPMAAVNILYNVGARDEEEEKTGFAHLFEHLMFEGSVNIPNFDEPLQRAGGESNAFTNNDFTNYYDIIPANNIETAFWLESDRMLKLDISEHSLDVQRKVVCEEFKENYLNQPYGDVWHKISDLAYKVHPYRWPTIGRELAHIEQASLTDVRNFFSRYYRPDNAILVVAGNTTVNQVKELSEKWFGDIAPGNMKPNQYNQEPEQTEARLMEVEADVPVSAIYKMYHMGDRKSGNYYSVDLISDILSDGNSSRLTQHLVKEQRLFSEIEAYVTGSMDAGLLILEGRLSKGVTMQQADEALQKEIKRLVDTRVEDRELSKVKNKQESNNVFSEVSLLNRAISLAFYELMEQPELINDELDKYLSITAEEIQRESEKIFRPENSSTMYYHSKSN